MPGGVLGLLGSEEGGHRVCRRIVQSGKNLLMKRPRGRKALESAFRFALGVHAEKVGAVVAQKVGAYARCPFYPLRYFE